MRFVKVYDNYLRALDIDEICGVEIKSNRLETGEMFYNVIINMKNRTEYVIEFEDFNAAVSAINNLIKLANSHDPIYEWDPYSWYEENSIFEDE
jgi:hypothetical protein